jgi:hypothetical protein
MLLSQRARRKLDRLVRKLLKQIRTKIQLRWPQSTNEGPDTLKNHRRDRLDSIHTNPNKEEHDMTPSCDNGAQAFRVLDQAQYST